MFIQESYAYGHLCHVPVDDLLLDAATQLHRHL